MKSFVIGFLAAATLTPTWTLRFKHLLDHFAFRISFFAISRLRSVSAKAYILLMLLLR